MTFLTSEHDLFSDLLELAKNNELRAVQSNPSFDS